MMDGRALRCAQLAVAMFYDFFYLVGCRFSAAELSSNENTRAVYPPSARCMSSEL